MKNILIYISPLKKFDDEHSILAKIQIDNSLSLGWNPKDIILATNFDYEYNGVKSILVDDSNFCPFRPLSTKTITVSYMLEHGMIEKGELYWVHDFDAYQMNVIDESEFDLKNVDVGFTTYGWQPMICLGSYFIKESSKDIFKWIKERIYTDKVEDEVALARLIKENVNNINNGKYKVLNITYNLGKRKIDYNLGIADKPIKVVHFHLRMQAVWESFKPIITKRLADIFKKHGFE